MILAIDPGTKRTGWVFINEDSHRPYLQPKYFAISPPDEMRDVMDEWKRHIGAIILEKPV